MNQTTAAPSVAGNSRLRMIWQRQVRQWHWISAAICLAAITLFSITGITLNHASGIGAEPRMVTRQGQLPAELAAQIAKGPATGTQPVPAELGAWLRRSLDLDARGRKAEWSPAEIYLSMPGPGTDAWLSINRGTGAVEYEHTDRGWIAYFNDLHKGRNTGVWWSLFIDVAAGACLLFSLTGLLLLQMQARQRGSTWPLVGSGIVLLAIMMIFFLH